MADTNDAVVTAAATSKCSLNRWTAAEVEQLLAAVKSAPTAKSAFATVAATLGRTEGTVSQKYCALARKRAASKKRRAKRETTKRAAGAPSRAAIANPVARKAAANDERRLRNLSTGEVVQLAQAVKTEVVRRQRELDIASKLFV